jgi:hypothetical protein
VLIIFAQALLDERKRVCHPLQPPKRRNGLHPVWMTPG